MTVTLRVQTTDIMNILRKTSTADHTYLHTSNWEQQVFTESDEVGIDRIIWRWHYFTFKKEILRVKEAALNFDGETYNQPSMAQNTIQCEVVDRVKFLFETITEDKVRALIEAGDETTLNILWGKQ